ncbi:hypothetical protein D3C73_1340500 [compost metagenome]
MAFREVISNMEKIQMKQFFVKLKKSSALWLAGFLAEISGFMNLARSFLPTSVH